MKRFLAILSAAFIPALSYAGGFQLYSESAADVLGVAGAVVSRGGNASGAWYNAATTTDIEVPTLTMGGSLIRLGSEYSTSRGTDDMDDQARMTGFAYAVVPFADDFRFTLAVNAPYGMITQWDSDSQLSALATFTSLRVCFISPGIAWKVNDELSVAAGFNEAIGVARMAKYIDLSRYGAGRNKMYLSAEGDGQGGFVSLFYRPFEDWAFGAHYQSRVRVHLSGDADYRREMNSLLKFIPGGANTTIVMPASLALGVENSSFENWRFMADAVWTQWSSYRSLDINFRKMPGTGKRGTASSYKDWSDVWSYHFGAEYKVNENWTLRCGYAIDISPSNSRTESPEMPDADKQLFTLGVGYNTEKWGVDLAYCYVYFDKAKLGSKAAAAGGIAERGTFDSDCHVLSAQLTYRF